jgi:hypothetical protein
MAEVWRKRNLRITVDRALGERLSEGVWTKLNRMVMADGAVREKEATPQSRSSRKRKNQGGGAQTLRARVVLKRMYGGPGGYPTRDEVSDVDLYDRFAKEYEKVEGKAKPASKLKMPSREVVMREAGRKVS